MYQRFDDPWHQSEPQSNALSKSRNATILSILSYNIGSLVEFGCGLGYFTRQIADTTKRRVVGVDISETAIQKARELHPEIEFQQDHVLNLAKYRNFDAILFAELTWYILPELESIFDLLLTHFPGKYFLHNLVFYKEGHQTYGRNHFTSFEAFVNYCPLKLIEWSLSETSVSDSTIETSAIFKIERK